ncbi:GNAT family N-acetyltransferase [Nocardia sp. NPDC057668]|uniref:GNAT family N-acetyltransferase n=1 Tax=Nocardia sp. NPDC057668 TaxID=3346202 RepID=UPI00366C6C0B
MRAERQPSHRIVRPGTPGDIPIVARLLARALEDDPLSRWWFPVASRRQAQVERLIASSAWDAYRRNDGIDIATDTAGVMTGAALWQSTQYPWRVGPSFEQRVQGWRMFGRRARMATEQAHAVAALHAPEHHWHLTSLGTRADMRGLHYGRELLEWGLERCHADRLPAHLETSNGDNVAFYEKFGFETTGVLDPPGGRPRTWAMRYEP